MSDPKCPKCGADRIMEHGIRYGYECGSYWSTEIAFAQVPLCIRQERDHLRTRLQQTERERNDAHALIETMKSIVEANESLEQKSPKTDVAAYILIKDGLTRPTIAITHHRDRLNTELTHQLTAMHLVVKAAKAYWAWVGRGDPHSDDAMVIIQPTFDEERADKWRRKHFELSIAIGKALAALEGGGERG